MLNVKTWLTIVDPIHFKDVRQGCSHGSGGHLWSSTPNTCLFGASFIHRGSHTGTEMGFHQTVTTRLEEFTFLYCCMLQYYSGKKTLLTSSLLLQRRRVRLSCEQCLFCLYSEPRLRSWRGYWQVSLIMYKYAAYTCTLWQNPDLPPLPSQSCSYAISREHELC